jgi:hypothetical protein
LSMTLEKGGVSALSESRGASWYSIQASIV